MPGSCSGDSEPVTPCVTYETVGFQPYASIVYLERGVGFSLYVATIVGGCDEGDEGEFEFSEIPHGSWMEEGDPLMLSVGVAKTAGDVSYQWKKDGVYLHGETLDTYTVDAVTFDDEGWYSCRVTDESKGVLETEPVFVEVFPAGSLPAAHAWALAVAITLCILGGAFAVARASRP